MRTALRFSGLLRRAALLAGLLAAAAALAEAQGAAQGGVEPRSALELRHRAEVQRLYARSSWPIGAARGGVPNELALPGWVAGALQAERGLLLRTFRHGGDEHATPSFVLETCVEDAPAAAYERLVDWLAGLQSAEPMPSLAGLGLTLGDVGFAGRSGAGPGTLAWIAFVRGNVAVRVSACDPVREPALDLAGIASLVDQAARVAPLLQSGGVPAKPRIDAFSLPSTAVVAGAVVRLDLAVSDPAGGRPHLEWIVGGPGQGYVEQAPDGSWQLHTTGPGALSLILEATGSTGTWTRLEARLDVLDD